MTTDEPNTVIPPMDTPTQPTLRRSFGFVAHETEDQIDDKIAQIRAIAMIDAVHQGLYSQRLHEQRGPNSYQVEVVPMEALE